MKNISGLCWCGRLAAEHIHQAELIEQQLAKGTIRPRRVRKPKELPTFGALNFDEHEG
jgi:hypothetical protein